MVFVIILISFLLFLFFFCCFFFYHFPFPIELLNCSSCLKITIHYLFFSIFSFFSFLFSACVSTYLICEIHFYCSQMRKWFTYFILAFHINFTSTWVHFTLASSSSSLLQLLQLFLIYVSLLYLMWKRVENEIEKDLHKKFKIITN